MQKSSAAQMVWTASKPRSRVDAAYYYLLEHKSLPEAEVRRKIEIDPRPLRRALTNSLVVSVTCAVTGVVISTLAGYAFAKRRFLGRAALFDLVLASMAVPAVVLMMPVFRLTVQTGIYDTLAALILPFCVTGFGILFMRYTLSAVPDSLVESARLDGLSEVGALFRVVLPSVWPSVLTLGVLQFLSTWNAFVLPDAVLATPDRYTVSVLLGRMMSEFRGLMWNDIMVVVIAGVVPVLAAFLLFRRPVLRGLRAMGEER
jgi:ABC-type glycerol-3-phosphate transport system permease component